MALLISLYNGKSPADAVATHAQDVFRALELGSLCVHGQADHGVHEREPCVAPEQAGAHQGIGELPGALSRHARQRRLVPQFDLVAENRDAARKFGCSLPESTLADEDSG